MNAEIITENAVIKSTRITKEDNGVLTFWLIMDIGSSGNRIVECCVGTGYVERDGVEKFRVESSGLKAMMLILYTLDVDTWEKLRGECIQVEYTCCEGSITDINKIGNILNDKWFNLNVFFEEMQKDG